LTKATAFALALMLPVPALAQVAEVQVTPARLALQAGTQKALYVAGYDAQGNLLPGIDFVFASSDTSVARVSAAGMVMAMGAGSATIEVRAGSRRGTTAVTVSGGAADPSGTIASVTLEPASVALLPLEPARLAVRAFRRDGSAASGAGLTWRSLDPKIAAVDRSGLVVGVAPGRTMIQASAGGVSAAVPVSVDTAVFTTVGSHSIMPGAVDTLVASVPAQGGRRLTAGLTWRSADSSVVRAGPAGEVTAVGPGQTEIIVTGYGMTGRIRVAVRRAVAAFTLVPRASVPVIVPLGTTRRFEARAEAADSTPIPDAPITWTIADTTIAQFAAETGMLTARRTGVTTLTARLEGLQPIVWTIQASATRVVLDRTRLGLPVGARTALIPSLIDAGGTVITGATPALTWTSDRPDVATVSGGTIQAVSTGRSLITAAAPWGASAQAEMFVTGDLLVAAARGGRPFGIYQVQLGAVPQLVPLLADNTVNLQPVYSPDRTRIAFSSNRAGTFDLYVMDADGGQIRRITSDPGAETDPAWTPDGRRLVHTIGSGNRGQIAVAWIDGTGGRTLTNTPRGNQAPVVSPDGNSIAFASARDGNYEIYQMDIDGANPRRLTNTREDESLPSFLPGGDLIYVSGGPRGVASIMRHAAGAPVRIVAAEQAITALAVDRDGSRLAYVTDRLIVQRVAGDAPPTLVSADPGEQVTTPSF
jgi:uncharacterized protein YjdB